MHKSNSHIIGGMDEKLENQFTHKLLFTTLLGKNIYSSMICLLSTQKIST